MAPQVDLFHTSELTERVRKDSNGKKRKNPVDLKKDCKLQELVQYNCHVTDPASKGSSITCATIVRTFRRCPGNMMVETTGWKDEIYAGENAGEDAVER